LSIGAVAISVILLGAGCGGSSGADQPAVAANLLAPAEIEKYPSGSPERAFLSFWSDLQFQSWAEVVSSYNPDLREFIGAANLIEAKKLNGSAYQTLKPEIRRVRRDGDTATIYYSLLMQDGTKELASTTWREADGNWQLIYDSRLDAELNQYARNKVSIEETGALPTDPSATLSMRATRSGSKAAALQAEFLEEELKTETP
jgi:hypothetical protein